MWACYALRLQPGVLLTHYLRAATREPFSNTLRHPMQPGKWAANRSKCILRPAWLFEKSCFRTCPAQLILSGWYFPWWTGILLWFHSCWPAARHGGNSAAVRTIETLKCVSDGVHLLLLQPTNPFMYSPLAHVCVEAFLFLKLLNCFSL